MRWGLQTSPSELRMMIVFCIMILVGLVQSDMLKSSQVTSCVDGAKPIATVSSLTIEFLPGGSDIKATLSGFVTQTITGGKVNFQLSIFNRELYNDSSDICSKNDGKSPCPINPGEFNIPFTRSIGSDMGNVPNIIASFPGADLQASMKLTDEKGASVGCAFVKLESSVTAKQPAITGLSVSMVAASSALAVAGVFIGGTMGAGVGVSSGLQLRAGPSPALADVVGTFQFIGTVGQLNLNLPPLLQQFSSNFAWTLGGIKWGFIDKILSNLRPSEYNSGETNTLLRRGMNLMPDKNATNYSELSGIASYSRKLGILPQNYFMTVLIIVMVVMVVFTLIALILRLSLEVLSIYRPHLFTNIRNHFALYYVGNLLRVFLLCYFLLATAALFQLTIHDYWLVTFFAVIVLALFCIGLMGFVSFRVTKHGCDELYSNPNLQTKYGALYSDYRAPIYTFFLAVLITSMIRAAAVGLLSNYVWAQMSILVLTELCFFIALFYYRPYASKISNNLMVFIGVTRIMNTALLFLFIESIFLDPIIRNIIGIILVAVQGLMVLSILAMTLYSIIITVKRFVGTNEDSTPLNDKALLGDQLSINDKHSTHHQDDEEEEDPHPMTLFRTSNYNLDASHHPITVAPPSPDADNYFPLTPPPNSHSPSTQP